MNEITKKFKDEPFLAFMAVVWLMNVIALLVNLGQGSGGEGWKYIPMNIMGFGISSAALMLALCKKDAPDLSKPESYVGKDIKFKELVEMYESELDTNMKGIVTHIEDDTKHESWKIYVDTSSSKVWNRTYMKANYWDKQGNATLTAEEAGYWPKNEKHTLYFDRSGSFEDLFEIQTK
jgi:hypothetical protein